MQEKTQIKICIIGETGVGKTSIIERYVKNSFYEETQSTISSTNVTKIIHINKYNKDYKYVIWDTAGQERYRSVNKFFYKNAEIIILVYDITNKNTYDEINKYWINQIKENSNNNCLIGILGNKCDLYENEQIDEKEVKNYCKDNNYIYGLCSAKENTGLEEFFVNIGEKYIEKYLNGFELVDEDNIDDYFKLGNWNKDNESNSTCCKK